MRLWFGGAAPLCVIPRILAHELRLRVQAEFTLPFSLAHFHHIQVSNKSTFASGAHSSSQHLPCPAVNKEQQYTHVLLPPRQILVREKSLTSLFP